MLKQPKSSAKTLNAMDRTDQAADDRVFAGSRYHTPVDLSRKLARTIRPRGGPAAELSTLADAAQLIADLEKFKQVGPLWDHCAGAMLKAASTGKKTDIEQATRCLEAALRYENWFP
jgi:hypothetical protein